MTNFDHVGTSIVHLSVPHIDVRPPSHLLGSLMPMLESPPTSSRIPGTGKTSSQTLTIKRHVDMGASHLWMKRKPHQDLAPVAMTLPSLRSYHDNEYKWILLLSLATILEEMWILQILILAT